MTEETLLEESAENMVDVEDELAERKQEATRRAMEAADEEDDATATRYWSPPIAGTSDIRESRYGDDEIDLRLMRELSDGTDSFTVPIPDAGAVEDPGHRFNRLLAHHGVDHGEASDLIGKRLPLRPRENPDNDTPPAFDVDYPPVPTLPNRALWRGRRAAERLGLIRWGKTPRVSRDIIGDITSLHFEDGRRAKAMPRSATGLFHPFGVLPEEETTLVPTERGMGVLAVTGVVATLAPLIAALSTGSEGLALLSCLWMLIAMVAWLPVWTYALPTWTRQAVRWTKQRFFPTGD